MKYLLPICLLLASCCGPQKTRTECVGGWVVGAAAAIGAGALVYAKLRDAEVEEVDVEVPEWSETGYWKGALVAPDKLLYSRHIYARTSPVLTVNGKTGRIVVHFKGETTKHRVVRIEPVDDPRAVIEGTTNPLSGTTDLAVLVFDPPVTHIQPVRIADSVGAGEKLTVWLRKSGAVRSKCGSAGVGISFSLPRGRQAQPGDSSSPVTNSDGELVSLVSVGGAGWGPNVTRIRDRW